MALDRAEIFDKVCDIAADVLGVEAGDFPRPPRSTTSMPTPSIVSSS